DTPTDTINFGSLNFSSTAAVNISEDSDTSLTGAITAGSLVLTSAGTISASGTLVVTGTATFAAPATNSITLNSAGNNFSTVVITSANNVILVDTNAIDLGGATVAGTLSVTANGAITDSGNLTVGLPATFAAGAANNITLDSA